LEQREKIIKDLHEVIDKSIEEFMKNIPAVQKSILEEVLLLSKELDIKRGNITNSINNWKLLSQINAKIERIILTPKYAEQLKDLKKTFSKIQLLQQQYFTIIASDFTLPKVFKIFKKDAIDSTIKQLTETGISKKVSEGIENLLRTQIRSGGKYFDLVDHFKNYLEGTKDTGGVMESHARTIVTDSLNTFSRYMHQTISSDFGFRWYIFTGSLKETSREACKVMVEDKYFHESQFKDIIKGNINGRKVAIDKKTKMPLGFKDNTTAENYEQLCNGWNCGHALYAVSDSVVPPAVRAKVKLTS